MFTKQTYEQPSTELIPIQLESGILGATGYGDPGAPGSGLGGGSEHII